MQHWDVPVETSSALAEVGVPAAETAVQFAAFCATLNVQCAAEAEQLRATKATLTAQFADAKARQPEAAFVAAADAAPGLRGEVETLKATLAFYASNEASETLKAAAILERIAALAVDLDEVPTASFNAPIDPAAPRQAWSERLAALQRMEAKMVAEKKNRVAQRDADVPKLVALVAALDMQKDGIALERIDEAAMNPTPIMPLSQENLVELAERIEELAALKAERFTQIKELTGQIGPLMVLCEVPASDVTAFQAKTRDSHGLGNIAMLEAELERLLAIKKEKMHSLCNAQITAITESSVEMNLPIEKCVATCSYVGSWEATPTDECLTALTAYAVQLAASATQLRPILTKRKEIFARIAKGKDAFCGDAKARLEAEGMKAFALSKVLDKLNKAGAVKAVKKAKKELYVMAKAWKEDAANAQLEFNGMPLKEEIDTAVGEYEEWRTKFAKDAQEARKRRKKEEAEAKLAGPKKKKARRARATQEQTRAN